MQNSTVRHELFFLHPTQNHMILLVLQVEPKKIVMIFCLICFIVAQQIWPCDFTKDNQESYQHRNFEHYEQDVPCYVYPLTKLKAIKWWNRANHKKPKHPKKGEYKEQNGRTHIQEDKWTT
jgi:hypothetical protein